MVGGVGAAEEEEEEEERERLGPEAARKERFVLFSSSCCCWALCGLLLQLVAAAGSCRLRSADAGREGEQGEQKGRGACRK